MKNSLFGLAGLMGAFALINPYYNKQTITSPRSPKKTAYNLPLWKVGKHAIYAKNEHDALKYAKKRGLWDGKSYPLIIA